MKYKISHANEIKTGYMAPNIKNISKGFDIKYYKIGNEFEVNSGKRLLSCTVVEKPFYDPKKMITKS